MYAAFRSGTMHQNCTTGAPMVLVQSAPTAPRSISAWCAVHFDPVFRMTEIVASRPRRPKHGGRQKGTPNRITVDLRRALRDLADANASRVQEWLDRVAEADPAEAMRLWLALLRFVTPTLQAAAIADITRQTTPSHRLAQLSDDELLARIIESPHAAGLVAQGTVRTKGELIRRLAAPEAQDIEQHTCAEDDDEELLR